MLPFVGSVQTFRLLTRDTTNCSIAAALAHRTTLKNLGLLSCFPVVAVPDRFTNRSYSYSVAYCAPVFHYLWYNPVSVCVIKKLNPLYREINEKTTLTTEPTFCNVGSYQRALFT